MKLEKKLIDDFLNHHPHEAMKLFYKVDGQALGNFLANVNPQSVAHSLKQAPPQTAASALSNMSVDHAAKVLQLLPMDTQLAFIHALNPGKLESMLEAMPAHHSQKLRRLIEYPKGSAGYLMDPLPAAILSDCIVKDAIKQIRAEADAIRYYIYITDEQRRLAGVVTLRQLLNSDNLEPVSSFMKTNVARLSDIASERDIIKHPRWRDFHELPVVDRDQHLVGVIRYETLGRLKAKRSDQDSANNSLNAVLAMSELYWLGMTGFLDTLSTSANVKSRASNSNGDPDDK